CLTRVAEQKVRLFERIEERIAEDIDHKRVGAGERHLDAMVLREAKRLAHRPLSCLGVRQDVSLDEQPFRVLDALLVDVPCGEMTGNAEASAHGTFGIGSDDAHAGAGRLANNDRVADVDAELFELSFVEEAIPVVADATDECAPSAELRKSNDR